MTKPLIAGLKLAFALSSILLFSSLTMAQNRHIDWAADTVSKADALGGKSTYVNTVRGSGQLATESIKLPVNKLKEIMDACAANNISDVSVMIVSIRQSDIARLKKNNPEIAATAGQIKGRQMLVFRVPRQAFAGAASSGASNPKNNPFMLSLLGAGLMLVDASLLELPAVTGDYYFSIGSICPPPAACDY